VAGLIAQRQEEEALQAEAEARLAAEQAARAEEDARLRELYPLPEDEDELEPEVAYADGEEEAPGGDEPEADPVGSDAEPAAEEFAEESDG
ncbi:MAG: transcription elongation factor NusA, partial [Cyanobium sp.]